MTETAKLSAVGQWRALQRCTGQLPITKQEVIMTIRNRSLAAVLCVLFAFAAIYFRASSAFRHVAFPITAERIDQEPDANQRRFLQEQKAKKENEVRDEKAWLNKAALLCLVLAVCSGGWYVTVRNRDANRKMGTA